jgi:voltage-gated potassium channel
VVALTCRTTSCLLGYTAGRTERIVKELTSEGRLHVVVCAWDDVTEHPMPEQPQVHFVRGDLTHADVMRRACVDRARTAVVDGRDDNESLAIAVAVDHATRDPHGGRRCGPVPARAPELRQPGVQCVQWHMPFLLTEEATDPGITQVYNDLMSSGGHGNTYSLRCRRPSRTRRSATARRGSAARSGRRCWRSAPAAS